METNYRKLAVLALIALTSATTPLPLKAAELSDNDKQFLAQYEKVRGALAADDLEGAKKAAAALNEEGAPIASSEKIAAARTEFAKLSDHAIKLAAGQNGYYIVNCPMLKKDWVQTSTQISNPYAGKEMLTCGVIKK
ncbi:MAG: hypothetical protein M3505_07460 [Verrucomicrobiota bacterium]|nr:DUF3347 domain-containing protein [Chthoniobacterales bacterium]MDQ3314451.1 hypothetical protein [Verrucomicrobiota bacterium]